MAIETSRLNRFDRARLSLVDRQTLPYGRYLFAPTNANISLTRKCESLCPHCAPAPFPDAEETLTRDQIEKYINGLRALPIEVLHIEGGEPLLVEDLLLETFAMAVELRSVMQYQLETNLFWCASGTQMETVLGRLARLNFESREKILMIAGNIDVLHSHISPLENNRRLISTFYDYFPEGVLGFSHIYSPGDQSLETFADMLERHGMLVEVKRTPIKSEEVITEYVVNIRGRIHTLEIDNKFPALVGRGRQLRTADYLEWRRGIKDNKFSLHDDKSFLYPKRPVPEILSLGWDGLIYHDAMFMHTGTYPIGEIATDTPEESIIRANTDPLLRRLLGRGFGSVFRIAKKVLPSLEADYQEALRIGLSIEEFALDTLASPEHNLKIVEGIIEEEQSGRLPDFRQLSPAGGFADIEPILIRYSQEDWTGIEHTYIAAVVTLAERFGPADVVKTLLLLKDKSQTQLLTLSLLKGIENESVKIEIYKAIVSHPELLEHYASSAPDFYQEGVKEIVKNLLRAAVLGDCQKLETTIEELADEERGRAAFLLIDNMLALKLQRFVSFLIATLPVELRAQLIADIYRNDHYRDKDTTVDLLRLTVENDFDIEETINAIQNPDIRASVKKLAS